MILLTNTSPGLPRREGQRHDGFYSGSLGERLDRARQGGMDARRRETLEAGGEAETVVRGLQRDAEYGIGCAGGRNDEADPAHSGRGAGGFQRDEPEL